MTTPSASTTWIVVPCGAQKADHAAPAAQLYTSATWAHIYTAAVAEAAATTRDLGTPARVVILSALWGLVDPTTTLDPYDVKMGDAGQVAPHEIQWTAAQLGITDGDHVYAMCPKAYRVALEAAFAGTDVPVFDVYEAATRGIGDHRGVATSLKRHA